MNRSNLFGVDRQRRTVDGQESITILWNSINWNEVKQNVNRLQTGIVKAVKLEKINGWVFNNALSMLELCEVKVSRRVLRGERGFKAPNLPGDRV